MPHSDGRELFALAYGSEVGPLARLLFGELTPFCSTLILVRYRSLIVFVVGGRKSFTLGCDFGDKTFPTSQDRHVGHPGFKLRKIMSIRITQRPVTTPRRWEQRFQIFPGEHEPDGVLR